MLAHSVESWELSCLPASPLPPRSAGRTEGRLKSQSLRMLNPPNGLALHGARSMKTSDGNSIVAKLCEDIVRVLAG